MSKEEEEEETVKRSQRTTKTTKNRFEENLVKPIIRKMRVLFGQGLAGEGGRGGRRHTRGGGILPNCDKRL